MSGWKGGDVGTVTIDATSIQNMIESALGFCARLSRVDSREEALEAIRDGDCCACGYLRYGLSKELGEYLGGIDVSVRAVYAYDPEHCTGVTDLAGAEGERGINLVVCVDRRSAALTSILASLEDAVTQATSAFVCPEGNGTCYMLDVKVADKHEVDTRRGYGALLSSIHVKPLKVWTRGDQQGSAAAG
jgi:hypothetical protein